jgi:hypothetical protein
MRLTALLFTAVLAATSAEAQPPPPPSRADASSAPKDAAQPQASQGSPKPGAEPKDGQGLPVSLDKIREALEQTPLIAPLRGLNDKPLFKIEVRERQRISLDDLIKSLDFKSGPVPAGGVYAFEQQRQMFPAVDNPLQQPYAAFNQGELLTILAENLAGKYLAGRAMNAITAADRAHAQAAAHAEVQQAVREYCGAQPLGGVGILICSNPVQ